MKEYNLGKLPIKSWCEKPESGAINQAVDLANHKAVIQHIALMPDTHQGMGMPIGGIVAMDGSLCPNAVGVDIACGMMAAKLNISSLSTIQLKEIVHDIKRTIPMGFNHQKDNKWRNEATKLLEKHNGLDEEIVKYETIYAQLGTLGGGNHFIEIQKDEENNLWIMIHSGSRNLGHKIATKYNRIAKSLVGAGVYPTNLAILSDTSDEGNKYLSHMRFCIDFSFKNRECMLEDCVKIMNRYVPEVNVRYSDMVNIHHNYANKEYHFGKEVWIHRKGATSAKADQLGIIPGSMGTFSYMVKGLGNPESFESCSHGAGRRMSRSEAKQKLSKDDFTKIMDGVVSEDVDKAHLDESPMAYKDISTVMSEQTDLVEIIHTFIPIANIKG